MCWNQVNSELILHPSWHMNDLQFFPKQQEIVWCCSKLSWTVTTHTSEMQECCRSYQKLWHCLQTKAGVRTSCSAAFCPVVEFYVKCTVRQRNFILTTEIKTSSVGLSHPFTQGFLLAGARSIFSAWIQRMGYLVKTPKSICQPSEFVPASLLWLIFPISALVHCFYLSFQISAFWSH